MTRIMIESPWKRRAEPEGPSLDDLRAELKRLEESIHRLRRLIVDVDATVPNGRIGQESQRGIGAPHARH